MRQENRKKTAKTVVALIGALAVFVVVLNTATVWHGALFVALTPAWGYLVNVALTWSRQ